MLLPVNMVVENLSILTFIEDPIASKLRDKINDSSEELVGERLDEKTAEAVVMHISNTLHDLSSINRDFADENRPDRIKMRDAALEGKQDPTPLAIVAPMNNSRKMRKLQVRVQFPWEEFGVVDLSKPYVFSLEVRNDQAGENSKSVELVRIGLDGNITVS